MANASPQLPDGANAVKLPSTGVLAAQLVKNLNQSANGGRPISLRDARHQLERHYSVKLLSMKSLIRHVVRAWLRRRQRGLQPPPTVHNAWQTLNREIDTSRLLGMRMLHNPPFLRRNHGNMKHYIDRQRESVSSRSSDAISNIVVEVLAVVDPHRKLAVSKENDESSSVCVEVVPPNDGYAHSETPWEPRGGTVRVPLVRSVGAIATEIARDSDLLAKAAVSSEWKRLTIPVAARPRPRSSDNMCNAGALSFHIPIPGRTREAAWHAGLSTEPVPDSGLIMTMIMVRGYSTTARSLAETGFDVAVPPLTSPVDEEGRDREKEMGVDGAPLGSLLDLSGRFCPVSSMPQLIVSVRRTRSRRPPARQEEERAERRGRSRGGVTNPQPPYTPSLIGMLVPPRNDPRMPPAERIDVTYRASPSEYQHYTQEGTACPICALPTCSVAALKEHMEYVHRSMTRGEPYTIEWAETGSEHPHVIVGISDREPEPVTIKAPELSLAGAVRYSGWERMQAASLAAYRYTTSRRPLVKFRYPVRISSDGAAARGAAAPITHERVYFHSVSMLPVSESEGDSEAEIGEDWMMEKWAERIRDFVDVSMPEKRFFIMWNNFARKHHVSMQYHAHIASLLERFARENGAALHKEPDLYQQMSIHLLVLHRHGIISVSDMVRISGVMVSSGVRRAGRSAKSGGDRSSQASAAKKRRVGAGSASQATAGEGK